MKMDKKIEELVEWVATKMVVWMMEGNTPPEKVAKEILSHPDLALIDRGREETEWPNTQLIIEHLSDILTTAEDHHDARGNSNQTLFKMDLDRVAQAIVILKAGFTYSLIPLAEAMKVSDEH